MRTLPNRIILGTKAEIVHTTKVICRINYSFNRKLIILRFAISIPGIIGKEFKGYKKMQNIRFPTSPVKFSIFEEKPSNVS